MAKTIFLLDEMPKKCAECIFSERPYSSERVYCAAELREIAKTWNDVDDMPRRPIWCPLEELPEHQPEKDSMLHPHNDPIDRAYIEGWNDCLNEIEGEW